MNIFNKMITLYDDLGKIVEDIKEEDPSNKEKLNIQ